MLIDPYRFAHDEFFDDTFMLLHVENGEIYERTGFPDVEAVGGGVVSSTQAKFGTQSFNNPGTISEGSNFFRVEAAPTVFTFPGEFTIEGWVWVRAYRSTYMNIFANNINFPSVGFIQLAIPDTTQTMFWNSNPGTSKSANTIVSLSTWHHMAITRDASNMVRMFLDGILDITPTLMTGTIGGSSGGISTFDIGRGHASDNADFDGFFEEIRITKRCRYSANFSVPTAPFPPFP